MKHFLLQAPLSQTRAQEILNAYGATPERWPEEERQAITSPSVCSHGSGGSVLVKERVDD
mgnify:CR=1 FL=1